MELVDLKDIPQDTINRDYRELMKLTFPEYNEPQEDDYFFVKKHLKNPFGESIGFCLYDNHKLIGMYLFLQWQFYYNGKVIDVLQNVDAAVHPSYRGATYFGKLYKAAFSKIPKGAFIFGFPVEEFKRGLIRFGWNESNNYKKTVYLPNLLNLFNLKLYQRKRYQKVQASDSLKEFSHKEMDEFLAHYKSNCKDIVTTNWNAKMLQWKFSLDKYLWAKVVYGSNEIKAIIFYHLLRDNSFTRIAIVNILSIFDHSLSLKKSINMLIKTHSANEVSYVATKQLKDISNLVKMGTRIQNFIYTWNQDKNTSNCKVGDFPVGDLFIDRLVSD